MTSIASGVKWGSDPDIYFDFSYEKKRSGYVQYYRITISCRTLLYSTSYFGYPINLSIKLDGATMATKMLKDSSPSQWSSALTYTTDWLPVNNKTTGTTALTIRIYSGSGSSRDATYSYPLATDPAASLILATDADIESVSTITIIRYNSAYTTTVRYKPYGQKNYTTIWDKQPFTSNGWVVPASLYNLIPNGREINVDLICETYNGSTLVGTESCTMKATTNESKCKPTVSINAIDVNDESIALTGNPEYIISGISNLKVDTVAIPKNGAKITDITVFCGGSSLIGDSVTFIGATEAEIFSIARDSRVYGNAIPITLTLINYIVPTIVPTINRDTPTGDTVSISVKGKWYNGSFGARTNTLRLRVSWKVANEDAYGDYTDIPVTIKGNEYTARINLPGFDYRKAYSFQFRVDDEIYTDAYGYRDAQYTTEPLSKGIPVFDWGEDDFNFNVPVIINGVNILEKLEELERLISAKG